MTPPLPPTIPDSNMPPVTVSSSSFCRNSVDFYVGNQNVHEEPSRNGEIWQIKLSSLLASLMKSQQRKDSNERVLQPGTLTQQRGAILDLNTGHLIAVSPGFLLSTQEARNLVARLQAPDSTSPPLLPSSRPAPSLSIDSSEMPKCDMKEMEKKSSCFDIDHFEALLQSQAQAQHHQMEKLTHEVASRGWSENDGPLPESFEIESKSYRILSHVSGRTLVGLLTTRSAVQGIEQGKEAYKNNATVSEDASPTVAVADKEMSKEDEFGQGGLDRTYLACYREGDRAFIGHVCFQHQVLTSGTVKADRSLECVSLV